MWRDSSLPEDLRVDDLMRQMTLEEKVAQLYSVWVGASLDGEVAPFQHELVDGDMDWKKLITDGLGQLTRAFGTVPVSAAEGVTRLADLQRAVVTAGRFGVPALAHEECLTGLTTFGATIFPTPLAWGATFDPALVEEMAAAIGAAMRAVGVHQGLAPVLDVTRDPRWGRTEETIGEDPYLVGTIGTAYVRGLQSAGVIATLKHFAGYSASRGGRNFAPVSVGPRELADVILPPFEMAVREGAGSVMHSYIELDGVPAAADRTLLTDLLRDTWGFTGTVVSDYFGVSFLESQHGVAASPGDAARLALAAGVDVELPMVHCFGESLVAAVRSARVPQELIDRACRRVLKQKCRLGLLDPQWTPEPADVVVDLDPPRSRALARRLAEESVVLLANDGTLPLPESVGEVAVIGPLADDPNGMLGCYTFPRHVGLHHDGLPIGVAVPTVLESLRAQLVDAHIVHSRGCTVSGPVDLREIEAAVEVARSADVCVVVLGDHASVFGHGTSGEGRDAADLDLPGNQARLVDALLGSGTPIILVMLSGRPYALGRFADRLAAVVQAFFPGEEGGPAVASVLTGRVCPSGRLPVSVPRGPGGQPWTYLTPRLGYATEVSSVDPSPLYPFGHGLSYTSFAWEDFSDLAVTIRNTGDRAGAEVIQLYLHDPVAQVTRPLMRLIGYARVPLEPGQARRVEFAFHPDLAAFTGRDGRRIVEPGEIELRLAASSVDIRHVVKLALTGPEREVGPDRQLTTGVSIADV